MHDIKTVNMSHKKRSPISDITKKNTYITTDLIK